VKSDLKLLLWVLLSMGCLVSITIFLSRTPQVKSRWVEKSSGDGPYKMATGSRTEEEKAEQLEKDLQLDGPFIILKTTSDVSVRFTTPTSAAGQEMNRSEVIPRVDY
jgi:hypothetical protein